MFKIGEFSKLSQISMRMLRYFDKFDLLKPDTIDENSYRYYTANQLLDAAKIVSLQKAGFTLQEIKTLLDKSISEEKKQMIIKECQLRKTKELLELNEQINLLSDVDTILERSFYMENFQMEVKQIPSYQVASVRERIPTYSQEGMLWEILYKELGPQQPVFAKPFRNTAIYHDDEYVEENPDVEIGTAIIGDYENTENIVIKQIPTQQVLCVKLKGSYDQIGKANAVAATWIENNGFKLSGLFYSVYIIGPGHTQNEDDWISELCYPISK